MSCLFFFQIKIENWYNLGSMFILENCMHEFGGGEGSGSRPPPPRKFQLIKFTQEMEGSFLRVAIKQKRKKNSQSEDFSMEAIFHLY